MAFNQIYLKEDINLFDNQKRNIKRLVSMNRALLTDRVGSGKTLSVLYSFAYRKEKGLNDVLLVFTPLNAYEKKVWAKDVEKFTTLNSISLDGVYYMIDNGAVLDNILKEYSVVYCKHTQVKGCSELIRTICNREKTLLAIDEVHAFKNPKSNLSKALEFCMTNCKCVWGITGTTLSRSLEDTYNIINVVSKWYLGGFLNFRSTYCKTKTKIVGKDNFGNLKKVEEIIGIKNPQAFRDKIEPLVISGESFLNVNFHYVDYNLSEREQTIYTKIANGITDENESDESWLSDVLGSDSVKSKPIRHIKDINAHSSRFIYLQSAADGVLTEDGTQDGMYGTKMDSLVSLIKGIVAKKQSVIVYFDYLCSLDVAEARIKALGMNVNILRSTGSDVIKDGVVTEDGAKEKPYVILGTRASSESVSYYFINNVVFFHIPTVPHIFVQLVGRITRKNTLYPDDLNCYIFRSENIDLYKLIMVSSKCAQMEITQGEELNMPADYKQTINEKQTLDYVRKILLWQR